MSYPRRTQSHRRAQTGAATELAVEVGCRRGARVGADTALAEGLGGHLEAFFFAFGTHDFYAIADLPDNAAALALAATVGGSGAMSSFETTPLFTPEEADEAARRSVSYRPPGA